MKKYRHKTYKHITAEKGNENYLLSSGIMVVHGKQYDNEEHTVPRFMIEESNDRELIEERLDIANEIIDELIDKGYIDCEELKNGDYDHKDRGHIAELINKHQPKITEEEIIKKCVIAHKGEELAWKKGGGSKLVDGKFMYDGDITELLKSKGLLAE